MKIEKLGIIKEIEYKYNKLVIFTGDNNSGKTYTSYLIYGLLAELSENKFFKLFTIPEIKDVIRLDSKIISIEIKKLREDYLKQAVRYLTENLKSIAVKNFKIDSNNFKNLSLAIEESELEMILGDFYNKDSQSIKVNGLIFKVSYSESESSFHIKRTDETSYEELENIIRDNNFLEFLNEILSNSFVKLPKAFYFPAERNGINVFKNELNENRLKTYDTIMNTLQYANLSNKKDKEKIRQEVFRQNLDLIFDNPTSSVYPKPISDYINFLNSMKPIYDNENSNSISEYIRDNIISGKYEINSKDNSVVFRQKLGNNRYKAPIPFHVTSSSIKSLYGLDYYLENIGREGDYLIIDEPELSLHPENQIKLATAISRIVESGYRVILSTHSDLLVRALINVLLENKIEKKEKFGVNDVRLYNFTSKKVKLFDNLLELNYFSNFDDAVFQMQSRYNDLLERADQQEE